MRRITLKKLHRLHEFLIFFFLKKTLKLCSFLDGNFSITLRLFHKYVSLPCIISIMTENLLYRYVSVGTRRFHGLDSLDCSFLIRARISWETLYFNSKQFNLYLQEQINTGKTYGLFHSMELIFWKFCRKRLKNPFSIVLSSSIECECIPWYGTILGILWK